MPQLKPSDYLTTTTDEVGAALARIRAEWLRASGQKRIDLKQAYHDLLGRLQELMFRDLKQIDQDPQIKSALADLQRQAELITKARREMATATTAIKRAQKIVAAVDKVLSVIGSLGLV
jgi:hypothetical protein